MKNKIEVIMDLSKIASSNIINIATGQKKSLGELWKDDTCVVVFLRRWGCVFCRLWAKEISEIEPILKKHDIKLIGVGPEDLGKEEFVEGKFFAGDLYVAEEKKTYSALGFKRFSYISVMASLLWKESRDAIAKGKRLNVGGNIKGDGLQNGGALIVGKGGKLLTHFVQVGPAEHMSNSAILKALNLTEELKNLPQEEDVKVSDAKCEKP